MAKTSTNSRGINLTPQQAETLAALRRYISTYNTAPTFNELSSILGYNCKNALASLRKRNLITWGKRKTRSLTILNVPEKKKTSNIVRKVNTDYQKKLEDIPPQASTLEPMVTEGPTKTRAIFRMTEAPMGYLNHKTIISVEQPNALQLLLKFVDGTALRIEVQATEEEPSLVLYLSTEVKLKGN